MDPLTYGCDGPVELHETHASWVFICAGRAYKAKKPVRLAFLDYSTLARRRAACREEVRVNRELAPGIYLGVRALVREGRGYALADEDAPAALEYLVEMRAFEEGETLAGLIATGVPSGRRLRALARRLAAFHAGADRVAGGGVADVRRMWRQNLSELGSLPAARRWDLAGMRAFAESFLRARGAEVERRRIEGFVRDGHGDLRCEHVLVDGSVRVVDRIEFAPALRRADVACDLAFLTMDLEARGAADGAAALVRAYRRAGMDPGGEQLRAFYAAHRALVRAKVALIVARERRGEARERSLREAADLRALAERLCWRARAPVLLVVCGPAASGKSTLAAELSRRSGMRVYSSDAVRKAAAGIQPAEHLPQSGYSERRNRETYATLARQARRELRQTGGAIVDATCRSRANRAPVLRLLDLAEVRGLVVQCHVPLRTALARARSRASHSISDATAAVAAEQHAGFEAIDELDRGAVLALDARRPLAEQVARVTHAVDARPVLARPAGAPPGRHERESS